MPEIDFFQTEDEEIKLVEFIVSEGAFFIPDHKFSPKIIEAKDTSAFIDNWPYCSGLYYIASPQYSISPLEVKSVYNEHYKKEIFYIEQRNGGPVLTFSSTRVYVKNGAKRLTNSSIGYYPTYWNTEKSVMEKPPAALIQFFKKIVKQIKRGGTEIKTTQRTFWLRPGIVTLRENGLKLNAIDAE